MLNQNFHPHQSYTQSNYLRPLTPREIVNRQITDFNYHVTEEDFDRMIVTDALSVRASEQTVQASSAASKNNTIASYDLLDNS